MFQRSPSSAAILAVVAVCASAACSDSTPSAAPSADRPIMVEAIVATAADVDVVIDGVGVVRASERAEIRPQVDGTVAEVLFAEGALVKANDLLVRLDDAKAQAKLDLQRAALDSAEARLRLAEQRLRRGRQLIAEDLISREAFEELESEHLAAAAAVREQGAAVTLAARELDEYHLRAPFAGTVGRRLVDVGNYVERGDPIVVLMQTDPVEIEFQVPDQHAIRLRPGLPVDIAPTSGGSSETATLSFINPRVDPTTRMLDLKATGPNPDGRLRDGQFVGVKLLLEVRRSQVFIPEEAVISTAGALGVYVIEEGVARRRDVVVGVRQPPNVEILEGVAAGETVVIGGQHRLHEGSRVAILGAEGGDDGA